MANCTFFRYSGGDDYEFQVTDKDIFYLVRKTKEGREISRTEISLESTDDAANTHEMEPFIEEARIGLQRCREQMKPKK
ncbi:MAG TPA: hypothetical protein VJ044_08815 [Candidatus Hodarchaeales archaeon]|nr:hypothetical protein [Candidatus Hodarchaeales archaeon]